MLRCLKFAACLFVTCSVAAFAEPPPTVPDGFIVEKVAETPLVDRPMMGCFDDRGRLYVCESAGTNLPAAELIADPQDQIRILTDTDGDGHFDRSTVFADKLVFPQGCLWYRGAVYTCSSPYLWKLEDTDGDDVCDKRTVLVKSFGFSGNAADIHGPFLGPDGRFYWCDGRHGHEIRDLGKEEFGGEDTVRQTPPDPEPGLPNPDGSLLTKGKAARIFSCRPDGSDVQVLCGGGMDNPVEVDFFETGECLGTVNLFYGKPRGDCLVHWIEGGVYPRYDQQDSVAEFKSTGELLTEVHNYGHVAVSGMTRYRTGRLFEDLPELPESAEFLVTEFNTHKLVHTVIQRDGATFRHVETRDLFVSPDPDCHPTDVIEDADGSLLVIDTGGWFRIGCPTSQIAKPQITGALYRIRRAGSPYTPRTELVARLPSAGRKNASADAFVADLREAPAALREDVVDRMTRAADSSAPAVLQQLSRLTWEDNPQVQSAASWALSRIDDPAASQALLASLQTAPQTPAKLIALRSLKPAELSPAQQATLDSELSALTRHESAALRRDAITRFALAGPSDSGDAAAASIESLRGLQPDRMLEHAATYALIRIADREATSTALSDPNPQIRRAALIALDQMDGGNLQREEVIPLLDTDDAALQKAVLDVIARHDGWASEAFSLVKDWIDDPEPKDSRESILRGFLIARAAEPEVQQLVADTLENAEAVQRSQLLLLEVMSRAAVDDWPAVWTAPLGSALTAPNDELRLQALAVIASRNLNDFDNELATLAGSASEPARIRGDAFAAVAARLPQIDDQLFGFLSNQLADSDTPVIDKLRILTGLGQARLSDPQLCELASAFQSAGAAVAPALLSVYDRPGTERVGLALAAALQELERESLPNGRDLRRVLGQYPQAVQSAAADVLAELEAVNSRTAERIDELVAATSGGDAQRGRLLFFGKQTSCSACHRVGGKGAQVGPDLSKIAAIRQPRDLLESILYPSASFARGYEAYNVLTEDGRVVSGVITRETAHDVVLRTSDLSEIRISRVGIDEMQPSRTSIMPQGLDARLTRDELRDLLAYLQSLK